MKKSIILALLSLFPFFAGAVTITIDAEALKKANGDAMPASGLVVLTAAPTSTFYGPTTTSLVSGDELLLMSWDLSAFATDGVFSDIAENLTLGGGWDQGDPLQLYWYPTLTLGSTAPGAGTTFGSYRHSLGLDGSDAWITPAQSDTISLKFFTTDAAFLNTGGGNAASTGVASQVVPTPAPEPSSAMLALASSGLLIMRRRRRLPAA